MVAVLAPRKLSSVFADPSAGGSHLCHNKIAQKTQHPTVVEQGNLFMHTGTGPTAEGWSVDFLLQLCTITIEGTDKHLETECAQVVTGRT